MRNEAKRPTVRKLFVERMRREGRGEEWTATLKQVMNETGKKYGQTVGEAMRRMGYEGPERERQLHREFLENGEKTKLQRQIDQERQQIRGERQAEDFEEAVRLLPVTASDSAELDWIRAHPAMLRLAWQSDKTKPIILTAEDILRAPSQAAVRELAHWANHPDKFFEMLLSEDSQAADVAQRTTTDKDMGLDEVCRLLEQVTGAEEDARSAGG